MNDPAVAQTQPPVDMHTTPYGQVHSATSVLALAMRLHQAIRDGSSTEAMLHPTPRVTNADPNGPSFEFGEVTFGREAFESLSFNMMAAACSVAVIQVDAVLSRLHDGTRGAGFEDLRDFVYMLRCAFGHDPVVPRWEIRKPKYKRVVEIKVIGLRVDLRALAGQPFDPAQIGGWVAILSLLEHARQVVGRIDHVTVAALGHPAIRPLP